jgi:hypothetical protein
MPTQLRLDWTAIERSLVLDGYALVDEVLDVEQCAELRAGYASDAFRSRVIMESHNFGRGEYQYYAYPLPPLVAQLRGDTYAELAPIANRWTEALKRPERFPLAQQEMLALCAEHGQERPTALILKYGPGDFNALHQDLYGEVAFPFQLTFFLSEPEVDYTGGEFVLVEQRPRAQSRPEVIRPRRGAMLVFPNRYRPVVSKTGSYRTTFKHGVSTVRSGERYTLGIIFHDAK